MEAEELEILSKTKVQDSAIKLRMRAERNAAQECVRMAEEDGRSSLVRFFLTIPVSKAAPVPPDFLWILLVSFHSSINLLDNSLFLGLYLFCIIVSLFLLCAPSEVHYLFHGDSTDYPFTLSTFLWGLSQAVRLPYERQLMDAEEVHHQQVLRQEELHKK